MFHPAGSCTALLKTLPRLVLYCCSVLLQTQNFKKGFHEFAEFVAEDVGTVDSGLNSMVLANNNELVLLPINEPTFGTKRKSQIQVRLSLCCRWRLLSRC